VGGGRLVGAHALGGGRTGGSVGGGATVSVEDASCKVRRGHAGSELAPRCSLGRPGPATVSRVRVYIYIVVFPYARGFSAYMHLYMYYILWPLVPW
jgi:hypothetical protein